MTTAASKVLEKARARKEKNKAEKAETIFDFFKVEWSVTREGERVFKGVTILQTGFLSLLRRMGFRRYDIQESYIIVRIENRIIEQMQVHRLREIVVRYFYELDEDALDEVGCPKEMLLEKLHRGLGTLTSEEKMSLLVDLNTHEDIKIVSDQIDRGYYFYKNGFVEVTKDGYDLRPYTELPGYIWKDQIIQRNFEKSTGDQYREGVYYKFACNVSGNRIDPETGKESNPERLASFITITGYNLHRYFQTKLRATIFLDSRVSDEPDGRSGKSLHCKAIREILNADPENGKQYITIDGKRFDGQNRFCFDEMDVTTKLVVFDDIKRGFQIEDFFNAIVDGIVRERKGDQNKIRIYTKMIFTLNYTIKIQGGSAKDRVVEFEFADYYSSKFSPEQEFGQWFFRDWDEYEYLLFDNFMMSCVMDYLKAGIIMPDTINLEARKLKDETAPEFITWMEDLSIEHEKPYNKKDLFKRFADVDDDGKVRNKDFYFLTQRKFTKWLQLYATYRPEIAGYAEYRSSGNDFIRFFYNQPATAENMEGATVFPGKSDRLTPITGNSSSDTAPF